MPGSKTFTSTKTHDLFEYNLVRDMEAISNNSVNKLCKKIVAEFFKLVFSASITTIISSGTELFLKLKLATDLSDILEMLVYAFIILLIFVGAYLLLQILTISIRFLSNLFLNNRRFKRIKKRDKRKFDLYIANIIMSGVSFENKSRYYFDNCLSEISSKPFAELTGSSHSLDLIMGYILGGIKALEQSDIEVKLLLLVKMSGKKEKINKKYIEFIGADSMLSYIVIAQHTLMRLSNTLKKLSKLTNLTENKEFNFLISKGNTQIETLISHFDIHKDRILMFIDIPTVNEQNQAQTP